MITQRDLEIWLRKWRWYQRNALPHQRLRIHYELAKRGSFARWPLEGQVLEMFATGRLEVGRDVLFEPGVWLTGGDTGRIQIGSGCFLNRNVMVAAMDLVSIGDHCMFANGCFVTDADHRFSDREVPVPYQGFVGRGPTRIGDNVWCGGNVVVTGGVEIGRRSVIGAGSVVTHDIPEFSIAVGAPARVIAAVQ